MGTGTFLAIVLAIIVIIVFFVISIYNTLIRFIESIRNNQKQIDIQLDRRFKVFESLINTVKQAMDFEKTTLKDVVALRNQAQQAHKNGDEKGRIAAENQISQIAGGLNLVFEQYPDLKATENALQLQEEIVNTENKLSFAKQALNDSIERYVAKKRSFFESMIVRFFPVLDENFEYWQLTEEKVEQHENYTVNF